MNVNQIFTALKGYEPKPIDDDDSKFAVLVPLIEINDELHLIYEVRSMNIKRQPGEISFPGGKIEKGETPQDAAVRETVEEIGVIEKNVNIITELDYVTNKNGFFVFPFLGYISDTDTEKIRFSEDEVSELFYVPLSFLLENEPYESYVNYCVKLDDNFPVHMVNNGAEYDWGTIKTPVYFYKYKDYIIWGLTAKITYSLIKSLKSNSNFTKVNEIQKKQ